MRKLKHPLRALHILTVISWLCFIVLTLLISRDCPDSDCGAGGLALFPLAIIPILSLFGAVIADMVFLTKRFAPTRYKRHAFWLVLAVLLAIYLLWLLLF